MGGMGGIGMGELGIRKGRAWYYPDRPACPKVGQG